jgi:hypothetical protein
VRIALVPRGHDASRTYAIEARATMAGGLVAEARVVSGYVPEETLALDVWLRDACRGLECAPAETCETGTCEIVAPLDPCALGRLDGSGPSVRCADRDAGPDAGDGGSMDGGEPDASPVDGGGLDGGETDAAIDAAGADAGGADASTADGGDVDGGDADGGAPTELHNVVFATSTAIAPGDLGGIAGADSTCRALATAAGLPRPASYVALLTTSAEPARARIAASRGWVRVDGLPFVDTVDDLAAGRIYYPIALAENGLAPASFDVSTATNGDLTGRAATCGDWTDPALMTGTVGDAREGPVRWVARDGASPCNVARAIYCFGTGLVRPLDPPPPPPAGARIAFLSTEATIGRRGGISGFDGICQLEASAAGLSGTFRAFAAPTSSTTAVSRFADGEPWYRPDGVLVARLLADLGAERLTAPIALDTLGTYRHADVWVGAASPASTAGTTCNDWGVGITPNGTTGVSSSTWSFFQSDTQLCGATLRLFCLEQ